MDKLILLILVLIFILKLYKVVKEHNDEKKKKLDRYVINISQYGSHHLQFFLNKEEMITNVIYFQRNQFYKCMDNECLLSTSMIQKVNRGERVEFKNEFNNTDVTINKY